MTMDQGRSAPRLRPADCIRQLTGFRRPIEQESLTRFDPHFVPVLTFLSGIVEALCGIFIESGHQMPIRVQGGPCSPLTSPPPGPDETESHRTCPLRARQASSSFVGFFPPGPKPRWSRNSAMPPNWVRITADSASLSCPGLKNDPIPVSLPQPHQHSPVGSRRFLAAIQGLPAWTCSKNSRVSPSRRVGQPSSVGQTLG